MQIIGLAETVSGWKSPRAKVDARQSTLNESMRASVYTVEEMLKHLKTSCTKAAGTKKVFVT